MNCFSEIRPNIILLLSQEPVTIAERSRASTVFARSEAGTVGSKSHSGHECLVFVYVCAFFYVCVQVEGLATSWSPVQGVLPTVPDQETEETQPYAPKAGTSTYVWEQRGRKKNSPKKPITVAAGSKAWAALASSNPGIVRGCGGPKGYETSRLPYFPDNMFTDGGEVVSFTRRPPFTTRNIPGTHFWLETKSTPGP
jgi:hypothetical protein